MSMGHKNRKHNQPSLSDFKPGVVSIAEILWEVKSFYGDEASDAFVHDWNQMCFIKTDYLN